MTRLERALRLQRAKAFYSASRSRTRSDFPSRPSVVWELLSSSTYAICAPKSTETIKFHLGDLLEQELAFDVVLAIDVFEHIEDYFSFLRSLKSKAQ
jgi:hypothetical protein